MTPCGCMSAHDDSLNPPVILRLPEVLRRTGLTRATLDRLEIKGQFPRRVRPSQRTIGWLESDVTRWTSARIAAAGVTAA